MSLDAKAYSMFGIECNSMSDAVELLVSKGVMTQEEADESLDCGELCGEHPYNFAVYSCYEGGRGFLGIEVDACDLYCKIKHKWDDVASAAGLFEPEGYFHVFVQWS